MNLWLRLIWLLITAPFRPKLLLPEQTSVLTLRVLPNDLDPSLHMNNGRYLTIMDLGRIDLLIRSGIGRAVWRNSWTPVANGAIIRFRRELRLFDRYRLETQVLSWSDQSVIIAQTFVFSGGVRDGQVAARAIVQGAIYDRNARRYVPVTDLMKTIDVVAESPPSTAEVEAYIAADRSMREASRSLRLDDEA
jgi:acyl-CoA thioesterase FadM